MTTKYKYIHFEKAPKGIGLAEKIRKALKEAMEGTEHLLKHYPNGFISSDIESVASSIDQALSLLPPPCSECGGSGEVPERDYIACCGYSACPGKCHKEDIITKHRIKGGYTFKCPICTKIFYREKLIDWPKIPCPCQALHQNGTGQAPAGIIEEFVKKCEEAHRFSFNYALKDRNIRWLKEACTHLEAQAKQIEQQADFLSLAKEEMDALQAKIEQLEGEIKELEK